MGEAATEVQFIPKEWPEIRTERLILRPVREDYAEDIHDMRSRHEVMCWRYENLISSMFMVDTEHL